MDPSNLTELVVNRHLRIPASELTWKFTGSGGPGGQHANTSNTRVELRFDIAGSPTLTAEQRRRLTERFGDELQVVASDERSQTRNRSLALERMAARLASALVVERRRVPTRRTR